MSRNELLVKVAAAISTLDETNGAPESMLYIGLCGMDMQLWEVLRNVLVKSGNVVIKGNYVTLTPAGRETAKRINEVIQ